MRRRTRTKTTGARLQALTVLGAVLLVSMALAGAASAEEQAVIAGTVFQDPGFALPRAEVTLTLKTPPEGTKAKKFKPRKILTDGRGEFAFRVPAAKSTYVLTVKAEGLESQEKAVELSGGLERTDTYFTLKPVSGRPGKN